MTQETPELTTNDSNKAQGEELELSGEDEGYSPGAGESISGLLDRGSLTIVIQLMTSPDGAKERLALLSIRLEDLPPVFSKALHSTEVCELLAYEPLAGLLRDLQQALPGLEKKAARKEHEPTKSEQALGRAGIRQLNTTQDEVTSVVTTLPSPLKPVPDPRDQETQLTLF